MSYNLGVLGVGKFARYLLDGFIRHDPNLSVILGPRNKQQAKQLNTVYGFELARDNVDVVTQSAIVLLSTKPAQVHESIADLPWRPDQLLVSVAAGITHRELADQVTPASVVICMPTNSGMIGKAAIPMFPSNPQAENFLSALGRPFVMPDENVYEAAATLGAYFGWLLDLVRESVNWLQVHGCDETQARQLITTTLSGVADVVAHRNDRKLEYLVDELRTPGGLTEHGLDMFKQSGAIHEWSNVLNAILNRLSQKY